MSDTRYDRVHVMELLTSMYVSGYHRVMCIVLFFGVYAFHVYSDCCYVFPNDWGRGRGVDLGEPSRRVDVFGQLLCSSPHLIYD